MAEKIKEDKIILEREYIVPLRKKVNLTHKYRRARKAVKVLMAFVAIWTNNYYLFTRFSCEY